MSEGGEFYVATPTGRSFHASPSYVKCVRGPVGSGKTVMSWMEIVRKTAELMPPMPDGVVRARWVVIRNTYDELKSTTVATAMDWFGKINALTMHWSPPLEGTIRMKTPKGDPMEIQLLFRAMDTPNAINHLLGLEISGIYVNEACFVAFGAIEKAMTRLGRYPKKETGGPVYPALGVIMDTNPTDTSNWWYKRERECPEGWEFFIQPPALLERRDPETGDVRYENNEGQDPAVGPAENVEHQNLGFKYWRNQLGLSQDSINRFVLNRWVTRKAGKPVYPEWMQDVHLSKKPLEFSTGLPVVMGQDFGRTPCTVIAQVGLDGQIRVLEEIVSEDMDIETYVQTKLRPTLMNKYRYYRVKGVCFCDPAGAYKDQTDPMTMMTKMNNLGVETVPAPVTPYGAGGYANSFVTRVNNVSELLVRRIGTAPALIVDPRCKTLIEGFNGGFHYRKMRLSVESDDEIRYTDEPEKNFFSHIHDALQYLVCGVKNSGMDFSNPYAVTDAEDPSLDAAVAAGAAGMEIF